MSRPLPTESALLRGHAGNIEALIDSPETVKGIALVCHPHPLFGGANTNKVRTRWRARTATSASR